MLQRSIRLETDCKKTGKGAAPEVCPKCNGDTFRSLKWICNKCLEDAKKSTLKLKLRWVFLGLGIALFILAILFYVLAWTVDFLVVDMTYDHETFGLNLSILFGSLLLTISLLIISQVWGDTSKYRENTFFIPKLMAPRETPKFMEKQKERKFNEIDHVQFRHFATSRFIAAILILLMASIKGVPEISS